VWGPAHFCAMTVSGPSRILLQVPQSARNPDQSLQVQDSVVWEMYLESQGRP
jgi:hypothetical protein